MLAKELKRPDLGWALVVLTVAVHADIDAIQECLPCCRSFADCYPFLSDTAIHRT